jgi:hypothetical protein
MNDNKVPAITLATIDWSNCLDEKIVLHLQV